MEHNCCWDCANMVIAYDEMNCRENAIILGCGITRNSSRCKECEECDHFKEKKEQKKK